MQPLPPLSSGHRPNEKNRNQDLPFLHLVASRFSTWYRRNQRGRDAVLRGIGRRTAGKWHYALCNALSLGLPGGVTAKRRLLSPENPAWFENYVTILVKRFRGKIKHYFTINEPQCFIGLGYSKGELAPGLRYLAKMCSRWYTMCCLPTGWRCGPCANTAATACRLALRSVEKTMCRFRKAVRISVWQDRQPLLCQTPWMTFYSVPPCGATRFL